jgi:hypothetical protein
MGSAAAKRAGSLLLLLCRAVPAAIRGPQLLSPGRKQDSKSISHQIVSSHILVRGVQRCAVQPLRQLLTPLCFIKYQLLGRVQQVHCCMQSTYSSRNSKTAPAVYTHPSKLALLCCEYGWRPAATTGPQTLQGCTVICIGCCLEQGVLEEVAAIDSKVQQRELHTVGWSGRCCVKLYGWSDVRSPAVGCSTCCWVLCQHMAAWLLDSS